MDKSALAHIASNSNSATKTTDDDNGNPVGLSKMVPFDYKKQEAGLKKQETSLNNLLPNEFYLCHKTFGWVSFHVNSTSNLSAWRSTGKDAACQLNFRSGDECTTLSVSVPYVDQDKLRNSNAVAFGVRKATLTFSGLCYVCFTYGFYTDPATTIC